MMKWANVKRVLIICGLATVIILAFAAAALADGTDPGVKAGDFAARNLQALYLYIGVPLGAWLGWSQGRLPGLIAAGLGLAILYPFLFHAQTTLEWLWKLIGGAVGAS